MSSSNYTTSDIFDPYNSAGGMWVGWVIYIVLLVPTLLFNILTITMIASSPVLRQKVNPFIVLLLAIDDAFLSLFCLLSCASDYAVKGIYLGKTGCEMEAIFIVFFMLSTGYTLCFISYHNEQRVQNKNGLNIRKCCLLNLVKWCWCALLTWLSTDGFNTEARVMPSGVYCLVSLQNVLSGLLFFIPGIVFIGSFLVYRYKLLFNHVRNFGQVIAPVNAHITGLSENQINSRMKSAKKMFLFIFWYFFCASPVLILALYETSGHDAWGGFHIMAGFCIHFNSLLNPGLYFWSNPNSIKEVPFIKRCFYSTNNPQNVKKIIIIEKTKTYKLIINTVKIKCKKGTWNRLFDVLIFFWKFTKMLQVNVLFRSCQFMELIHCILGFLVYWYFLIQDINTNEIEIVSCVFASFYAIVTALLALTAILHNINDVPKIVVIHLIPLIGQVVFCVCLYTLGGMPHHLLYLYSSLSMYTFDVYTFLWILIALYSHCIKYRQNQEEEYVIQV